ncbi:MAG: hypothetical protein M3Z24_01170 [Chloroflexota bacterium]|nr:hypothetical protein [Chloroflexota bacterium]
MTELIWDGKYKDGKNELAERGSMNKRRIIKQILAFISIIGSAITVILFSIAITLYFRDTKHYDTRVLPVILIPFDVACLVTIVVSVVLYVLRREDHGQL